MVKIRQNDGLSFDDVLLVPQHSEIESRSDVDLSTKLGNNLQLKLPILSANMDTVTEDRMAVAMGRAGGAGVLHRFAELEAQSQWVNLCRAYNAPVILSVGVEGEHYSFLDDMNPHAICVDVAHGDHAKVMCAIKQLRMDFPGVDIIAGNVATGDAAMRLVDAGANIIKVGIGPGSVCSTRVVSGHGVPQLTAIMEVGEALEHLRIYGEEDVFIVADGGIRYPGDIVKALAAGADAVMLGSLLAGTEESPGEVMIENGKAFKAYRGSASYAAQKEKRAGRTPRVEGVSAKVPYRGPVDKTLENLAAGIRSGFSYSGASCLRRLHESAEFIVVTGSSLKESHPHHPYRL